MKRLRQWLFNGLAAISLLAFVATLLLYPCMHNWCRSMRWSRVTGSTTVPTWQCIDLGVKPLTLQVAGMVIHNDPDPGGSPGQGWKFESMAYRSSGDLGFVSPTRLGFGMVDHTWHYNPPTPATRRTTAISTPIWFMAALFAVLPALRAAVSSRERRERRGHVVGLCRSCGYDIRSTPDRCPECGTAPAKSEISN
jgi:hypothetical protein